MKAFRSHDVRIPARLTLLLVLVAVVAGCGSSKTGGASKTGTPASTGTTATTTTGTSGAATSSTTPAKGGNALLAEAQSKAAGDIPDNQVFLTYRDSTSRYSLRYPEGWTVSGSGAQHEIRDKNNVIRITVSKGAAPTEKTVRDDMAALAKATPSLTVGKVDAKPSCQNASTHPSVAKSTFHVTYSDLSAPNPVTGKRSTLLVDRYYYPAAGRVAVIDFGTPQGVDNVDAYCQIAVSFSWT